MDLEPLKQQVQTVGISETARRAGIHRVSVSKWIAGKSLSLDHVARIAQAVGWELVLKPRQSRKKRPASPPTLPTTTTSNGAGCSSLDQSQATCGRHVLADSPPTTSPPSDSASSHNDASGSARS